MSQNCVAGLYDFVPQITCELLELELEEELLLELDEEELELDELEELEELDDELLLSSSELLRST